MNSLKWRCKNWALHFECKLFLIGAKVLLFQEFKFKVVRDEVGVWIWLGIVMIAGRWTYDPRLERMKKIVKQWESEEKHGN